MEFGSVCDRDLAEIRLIHFGDDDTHGELTEDNDLPVTNPWRFADVLGVEAPSRVEINVPGRLRVRGFLNGTSDFCTGATFHVDGEFLGRVRSAFDLTPERELGHGLHVLETRVDGSSDGCHTVWGFDGPEWVDNAPAHYIAVGAICKDENVYLGDWVRHHAEAGVSHFFLLDNGSRVPLAHTVEREGLSDIVTVESFPWLGLDTQIEAYHYLLQKRGHECCWMALIDVDEFLIPKISPCLKKVLSAFEEYGALMVPWMMFGSNGLKERPSDQLAAFTDSYIDPHVKGIVRPLFVERVINPHRFEMMPGRPAVGEHFDDHRSTQHLQINHYWTRSLKEWGEKIGRGAVVPGYERSWEDFHRHQARCISEDFTLLNWKQAKDRSPALMGEIVTGFIHAAAVNHWEAVLEKQIAKMRSSGLWDKTSVIYLGITGATEGIEAQSEILRNLPSKVKIVVLSPELGHYEFPTLEFLQEHCRRNDGYVWYIHTKGVVNSYASQRAWRNRMEEFVLIHHELAINRLDRGYAAAAGYGELNERWPIPGNFWWARSGHIRSLPDVRLLNQTDRHEAERWIAMNGIQGFYWHDYGDTAFDGWEITSAQTGAGIATTGGYHSWEHIPVLPPKGSRCDVSMSAHAPSCVVIKNRVPLRVFGFTCGSARIENWRVEFLADGQPLGAASGASLRTGDVLLPPGKHRLTVRLEEGERWGAHTAWGVSVFRDLQDQEDQFLELRRLPEIEDLSPLFPLDTRTGILQSLVELRGCRSYLEIGVGDGGNFRAINCPEKVSVDPEGTPVYRMTSDEFFAQNTRTFDLIFIDGLHVEETVMRDIENALRMLSPGGAVVCHDMNPADEAMQRVPRSVAAWTGDCWKAWLRLRAKRRDCFMTVFDTDYGVGVIIPGAADPNPPASPPPAPPEWEEFETNKTDWLDLRKPEDAWRAVLKEGWGDQLRALYKIRCD